MKVVLTLTRAPYRPGRAHIPRMRAHSDSVSCYSRVGFRADVTPFSMAAAKECKARSLAGRSHAITS